jgi:uncharacterized protein involved in exopolysaccharide biosynthesis
MVNVIARVLLVLSITALAGGAALLFSDAQPREYQSSMRFGYGRQFSAEFQLLGPSFTEPAIDENVRIRTEAAVLDSSDIAALTAKAAPDLGLSAGQIDAATVASPLRDTLTVSLRAAASTPQRAVRLASVYGRQYLKFLRERERKRAVVVERALRRHLRTISQGERRGPTGANLRSNISRMRVLQRVGTGNPFVIERPRTPGAAASPQTVRNVLFGLLFGLFVAIGLVALQAEGKRRATRSRARRAASTADAARMR